MAPFVFAALAVLGAGTTEIAGRHLRLGFSGDSGGIVSIQAGGHEFVEAAAERPLLWRLTLRDRAGREAAVDNAAAPRPSITVRRGSLVLRWEAIPLPEGAGTLAVRVQCELGAKDETARLRLWVRNGSGRFGLWTIQFPVVSPVGRKGGIDVAVPRGNWGELLREAAEPVSGTYPSHNLPMQFLLVQKGQDGLCLAAHDPGARPKEFSLAPGGEFRILNWADDMGVPGNGWDAPYAAAIGAYEGGWMAGCKHYRAWVLRNAPWTRRGPLHLRRDVAESIRRTSAWIIGAGSRQEAVPVVKRFAEAIGAPVGTHWYNWHQIPFDTDYPSYFPPKPGFADGVRELREAGVLVMPYINARLWDVANREFPAARPHACKDERGAPLIEEYGSGAKLAVMCPATPFWQQRVGDIVRRLVGEEGVGAVYLDQIASAPPRHCFDPGHGHPLGSGRWWVDGYRKMLEPIKRWCVTGGRRAALTTENNAEPYMDTVDAFLIWTPRDAHEIPMVTAVYSGRALYFASNRALAGGDEAFCLLQARDFVWGTQLGWEGGEIVQPAHAAKLEFQGRLARVRARSLDWLAYGELLAVLDPGPEIPAIAGRWNTWRGDRPVTLPAVHAALWRAPDGRLAIVAANADTRSHRFRVTLDSARLGEGPLPRAVAVEVPARDGVVVAVSPARR